MLAVASIMRAEQILIARLKEMLRPWDLTFARYEALMLLHYSRNGSLPLGKMGDRLQIHPTSVTNIIDGLERLGYVTRESHERDRRTTLARITPAGRRAAKAATKALNDARFGTAPLQDGELEQLFLLLEGLRSGGDEPASGNGRPSS
jgi:DNA-binding MarR family transcriptional regulator